MHQVTSALDEVRALYQKVLGKPAPEIEPRAYISFPPGVDPLDHAVHEVDELKRLSEQLTLAPGPAAWTPVADAYATDEAYILRLDIPGVRREDLKVWVAGRECVVRGDRRTIEADPKMRPLSFERAHGPFERRFPLPANGRSEDIKARYENGVLELRIALEESGASKGMNVEVV